TFKVTGINTGNLVASAGPSAATVGDEDAEVTLPEVDPVHVAAGDSAVPPAEQKRIWDEATSTALSYSARLPNFRCNRETRRLISGVRSPDQSREADAFI